MTIDIPIQQRVTSFIQFSQSCPSNTYYPYFTLCKPYLNILICSHPSTSLHFCYIISVKSRSKELTCQMHQLLIVTYARMHSSIHLCFRTSIHPSIHPTSQLTIYSHTQQSIGLCTQPSKQPSFPILASN